jgi:phosphatidylserine/phosphatidylglycerophosphate/cardiolipin synthase-like enzyme
MGEGYSGDQSHRFVDDLIAEKGDLFIITPYIDAFYAERLLRSRSRKVRVITSGAPNNSEALAVLSRGRKPWIRFVGIYFLILAGLLCLAHFYTAAILCGVVCVLSVLWIVLRRMILRKGQLKIEVKVVKNLFVHEKIYIGTDNAIVGSANLTYNGMHKNIEHIEIISDPSRVAELKSHFNRLWGM